MPLRSIVLIFPCLFIIGCSSPEGLYEIATGNVVTPDIENLQTFEEGFNEYWIVMSFSTTPERIESLISDLELNLRYREYSWGKGGWLEREIQEREWPNPRDWSKCHEYAGFEVIEDVPTRSWTLITDTTSKVILVYGVD